MEDDTANDGGVGTKQKATTLRGSPDDALHLEETIHLTHDEDTQQHHNDEKPTGCCQTKYSNALKHLLPCRTKRKDKKKLPSNEAGLFSYFSVAWLTKLMWKAYKVGLQPSDMWLLQSEDGSEKNSKRLERLWEEEKQISEKLHRKPEFWRAVWKLMRTRVIVCMVISVVQNVLQFLGPSLILKLVLDYINECKVDYLYGAAICGLLFTVNIVRGICFNAMFVVGTHTATRVTGAVQAMIYRKALKLKTGGERLSAQITNFCNNDMERLFEASISSVFITAMPVIFSMSVVYSLILIGPWSLLGLAAYFMIYPIMGCIAKAQSAVRVKIVKITDRRVTLMGEILNSMRLIKMYSWEDSFAHKIKSIRKKEMQKHRLSALLQATSSTVTPSISVLATIVTLLGVTLSGNDLSSSAAFTIFSVFNAMQFTVAVLPFTVRSIAEAKISLGRIQRLLDLPEHSRRSFGLVNNQLAVQLRNATFAWQIPDIDFKAPAANSKKNENQQNGDVKTMQNGSIRKVESVNNVNYIKRDDIKIMETLFDISISIPHGALIGVCGSVGSGKSSLVSALCGDMQPVSGDMQINGKLALVTQQAWIYNETLQENIIMGQKLDEKRYQKVIHDCALESDIELMADGDMTEIGDRGTNLSGGQKQRVNLGRAVYSNRDIYLLDDPLSAVDSKVARHIFVNCFQEHLKSKTRILITHATHFLEECDEILVLDNGHLVERGTHEELIERKGEYFQMLSFDTVRDTQQSNENNQKSKDDVEDKKTGSLKANEEKNEKVSNEEKMSTGGVSATVYSTLFKVSGGWCIGMLIFFTLLVFTLSRMGNAWWLKYWLDQGDGLVEERRKNFTAVSELCVDKLNDDELKGDITKNPDLWMYQLVYGLSFIVIVTAGIIKGIGVTFRLLAGASKLHNSMFNSIIRSPMSFFDTTPTGRILNRFSRDQDELDVRIPVFMEFVLQGFFFIIGQIILVCFFYVWFIIPLVIVFVLFIGIDIFLNTGVRHLKRLDNTLRSPVIQLIGSSMSGLPVIRSYEKEGLFTKRFFKVLDRHSVAQLVFRLSNRWFTYRMDFMAVIITFFITTLAVFTKGAVSTATAGLALSTINGVCVFVPFIMRMKSELTSRLNSVERIIEYAYDLKSEAPREIENTKPQGGWPEYGAIEMKDVKLRYREGLPLVIHGITASIKPGEKIGIIGRTGAGKSSLISTLLRLAELDSGTVEIDGINISTIGLHTLRSAIAVIPQDPVLFQGTIRYNLDPFDHHTDDAVWLALERSHLKDIINKMEHGLNSKVEVGGENFSVGERQLICLTRALLRNSKILLLDEATASVDIETDHMIQNTIKDAFAQSTVLTIAHRLNTVANYDRIMGLDAGKVHEFDRPEVLMVREDSMFREMMAAMGINTVQQLKQLN